MNTPILYMIMSSPFGDLAIVWREASGQALVQRVILPGPRAVVEGRVRAAFAHAQQRRHPAIADLAKRVQAFLEGQPVDFALDAVELHACSEFQQRVLVAEHGIPRGWVSTYGLIAAHLGVARGARAVGRALATNPFPLIIPCHRAITCSGEVGGYQGGLTMKRRLLEMEGVEISETGKVVRPQLHYAA